MNQWPNVISHFSRIIYSLTTRYLNNTSENGTNAIKWGKTNTYSCKFCDEQQSLGHIIGGCRTALLELRYNWRHEVILLNIYKAIKSQQSLEVLVDIEGYPNLLVMTVEGQRPDFAIVKGNNMLLELDVLFETNIVKKINRKVKRCEHLLVELSRRCKVYYVNLSLEAFGVIGNDSLIKVYHRCS